MNALNAIRHVLEQIRRHGPRAAIRDLGLRAINRVVRFQLLEGMTAVMSDVSPAMFDAGGLEGRFCSREELLASAGEPDIAGDMSPEFIVGALASGDECYGLFDGATLAAYGWYSSRPTAISEELVLHFDPSWIYMYKGFTVPAYRGKRLHGIGMSLALRAYTERGRRGLISYVSSNNFASLRSTERMGYRIFGQIYVAQARGRALTWATRGCRPYAFRIDARRPLPVVGEVGAELEEERSEIAIDAVEVVVVHDRG